MSWDLAFTRYSFTSTRLCTNRSSSHSRGAPALPTLLQVAILLHGYWAIVHPLSTSVLYVTHYTTLVITISCKGQLGTWRGYDFGRARRRAYALDTGGVPAAPHTGGVNQSIINQRSSLSHKRAGKSRSQHCHRGQQTLCH